MTRDASGRPLPGHGDNLPRLSEADLALIGREGVCDPLLAWAVEEGIDLAVGIHEDLVADGIPDALAWTVPVVGGRFDQVMQANCEEEELRRLRQRA